MSAALMSRWTNPLEWAASRASAISVAKASKASSSTGFAGDAVLQGRAIEVLHGDEGAAVVLSDVVNGADVGMIERGGGLGFALKTGEGLGIAGHVFGQEFQGDKTMEAGVLGLVNHAHASATEFLDDAVVRDGLVDHWRPGLAVDLSYGWGGGPSTNAGRWSVLIWEAIYFSALIW